METFEWYLSRSSHSACYIHDEKLVNQNIFLDSLLVRESMTEAVNCLGWLHFAASDFQNSLYHQKHAFYFHNVEQWVAHLWVSTNCEADQYEFKLTFLLRTKNGWRRMISKYNA